MSTGKAKRNHGGVDWLIIIVVFGIPVCAAALVGFLLGSWLVFVLLCVPLCSLTLLIFLSQTDGRTMAARLVAAAEESLDDGNRYSAASLLRQAADILEGVSNVSERERQLVNELRARADKLER